MVLPTPQSRDRGPLITSYPSWGHQPGIWRGFSILSFKHRPPQHPHPRTCEQHRRLWPRWWRDEHHWFSPFTHVFAYSHALLRTTPSQHCDRPGDRQVGGSAPPSRWSRPPDGTLHITLRPVGRRKAQRPCGELSADTANAPGEVPRTLPARPPRK